MPQHHTQESFIKYLAGLLDADGCLSFEFKPLNNNRYCISLRLTLAQRKDRLEKLADSLSLIGGKFKYTGDQGQWVVNKLEELNSLLPKLLKHMVIKAKYWDWLYSTRLYYKGTGISKEERESLSLATKYKRQQAGPLKAKKHPTWAWVAGYLDGDGWYSNSGKGRCVQVACWKHDKVALDLLYKAFGGTISAPKSKPNMYVWYRGLGQQNAAFAISFLPKVLHHSRLKKHKIECMLHDHRQRLTERNSTE